MHEGVDPLNAAKEDRRRRGSGILLAGNSRRKFRLPRQEVGDLNVVFGDRDRNRGSGICVRARGARG